jgi:hypothetical protein
MLVLGVTTRIAIELTPVAPVESRSQGRRPRQSGSHVIPNAWRASVLKAGGRGRISAGNGTVSGRRRCGARSPGDASRAGHRDPTDSTSPGASWPPPRPSSSDPPRSHRAARSAVAVSVRPVVCDHETGRETGSSHRPASTYDHSVSRSRLSGDARSLFSLRITTKIETFLMVPGSAMPRLRSAVATPRSLFLVLDGPVFRRRASLKFP